MGSKILFVPNDMLPEAALPDATFMFIYTALTAGFCFC